MSGTHKLQTKEAIKAMFASGEMELRVTSKYRDVYDDDRIVLVELLIDGEVIAKDSDTIPDKREPYEG